MKVICSTLQFLAVSLILLTSCQENNTRKKEISGKLNNATADSLEILQSKEYQTVLGFLKWYKEGHNDLRLSAVEKEFTDKNGYYCTVDTNEAHTLLHRYRQGGFFTQEYIKRDSIYIWKAMERYRPRDLEIYDSFDHDFVLHTQETVSALKAIPNVHVVAEKSDLNRGKIALDIEGCPLLVFQLTTTSTGLKIAKISN